MSLHCSGNTHIKHAKPAAVPVCHPLQFHAKSRAPVFAYSNTFGEGGMNATGLYYLASAADKVFMPPTSCLSLLGFESTQVRLLLLTTTQGRHALRGVVAPDNHEATT